MYNYTLSILKKYFSYLYKFLKIIKNRYYYNHKFKKTKKIEIQELIISLKNESFLDFQKKNFFNNKDKKSDFGVLEINNSCNINCVMCDTKSSSRKKKLMDLELCEKSIIEMKSTGIKSVILHTIGDPLANAKLKDYLKLLRKYKLQASISTNGLMLDKHINTLIEYFDICSNIRFSIDGVRKATYEKIRFGGNFEKLIENLNLAKSKLKNVGYEFMIDLVITKDNFNELGEFIVFFKNYINNPYKNMHFNFMNSLSPSNDYFLKNNLIQEHTYKNMYCNFASQLTPYILVDGRVSACCRDYDGSLVVDDIYKNNLNKIYTSDGFKNLQQFHINENSNQKNEYNLCKSCYIVDTRIAELWKNIISLVLFKYPDQNSEFYQNIFNELLKTINYKETDRYNYYIEKYALI